MVHSLIRIVTGRTQTHQKQQFSATVPTLNFTTLNLVTTSKPLVLVWIALIDQQAMFKGISHFPSPVLCLQCL